MILEPPRDRLASEMIDQPSLSEEAVIRRVWKVTHELPEEGTLALFDVNESQLVILNSIGAVFWSRLDGVTPLGQIASEISDDVQGAPWLRSLFWK